MSSIPADEIEVSRKEDLRWFLDLRAQHLSQEAKELLVEKLYIMIYLDDEDQEISEVL